MLDETGGTDASWVTDVTPGETARPRAARLLADSKGALCPNACSVAPTQATCSVSKTQIHQQCGLIDKWASYL